MSHPLIDHFAADIAHDHGGRVPYDIDRGQLREALERFLLIGKGRRVEMRRWFSWRALL